MPWWDLSLLQVRVRPALVASSVCHVLLSISLALTHPTVSITDNSASAVVGSSYPLTCVVTIPDGVTISGTPHVEFEGPGLSATGVVTGSGSDFSSTETVSLSLSSRGDYACSAQYFVDEDVSPKGIDTLTANVMSKTTTQCSLCIYILYSYMCNYIVIYVHTLSLQFSHHPSQWMFKKVR